MNIVSLSFKKFMDVSPDRCMKSDILDMIEMIKSNPITNLYLIEPEGLEFDVSHLKITLESISKNHIVLDYGAIRLNLFNELSDFHKLTYTVHNPIFGTEKLGMSPFGLIVTPNVMIESLNVLSKMLIHGMSTLVMLTPIIYRVTQEMEKGILLTEVPTKGKLVKKEYSESDLRMIRSYVETILGDKTDKFIEEFSYVIK